MRERERERERERNSVTLNIVESCIPILEQTLLRFYEEDKTIKNQSHQELTLNIVESC